VSLWRALGFLAFLALMGIEAYDGWWKAQVVMDGHSISSFSEVP